MRCPKCGFVSFDHNENCPKCKKSVVAVREQLRLPRIAPQPQPFLEEAIARMAEVEETTTTAPPPLSDHQDLETFQTEAPSSEADGGEIELQGPEDEIKLDTEIQFDEEPSISLEPVEDEGISMPLEAMEEPGLELTVDEKSTEPDLAAPTEPAPILVEDELEITLDEEPAAAPAAEQPGEIQFTFEDEAVEPTDIEAMIPGIEDEPEDIQPAEPPQRLPTGLEETEIRPTSPDQQPTRPLEGSAQPESEPELELVFDELDEPRLAPTSTAETRLAPTEPDVPAQEVFQEGGEETMEIAPAEIQLDLGGETGPDVSEVGLDELDSDFSDLDLDAEMETALLASEPTTEPVSDFGPGSIDPNSTVVIKKPAGEDLNLDLEPSDGELDLDALSLDGDTAGPTPELELELDDLELGGVDDTPRVPTEKLDLELDDLNLDDLSAPPTRPKR